MSNPVHVIVQPGAAIAQLGGLMKHLAGRRTRAVNRHAARTGTLREGRCKSGPIATDADLLACRRDVALDPVRAPMTETRASYPWSRYRRHAGEPVACAWLDVDPCCAALGSTAEARATTYRALVRNAIPQGAWRLIRKALQRDRLSGSARCTDRIEARVRRRIEHRGHGRPRKGRRADAGRKSIRPLFGPLARVVLPDRRRPARPGSGALAPTAARSSSRFAESSRIQIEMKVVAAICNAARTLSYRPKGQLVAFAKPTVRSCLAASRRGTK
jgi:putative transposase